MTSCGKDQGPQYRIGVDQSFFPLELYGKESNVFGFTNELLTHIAAIEKIKIIRVDKSWDNLILGLKEGEYDAMISSMEPYVFNREKYQFSEDYLLSGPVVVMREENSFSSIKSLSGKEVAVSKPSDEALLLIKNPNVLVRYYSSIPNVLISIVEGEIDAALIGIIPASSYLRDLFQEELKIVTPPLNNAGLRVIALKGENQELVDKFNEGLAKMKKSGKYDELAEKWMVARKGISD